MGTTCDVELPDTIIYWIDLVYVFVSICGLVGVYDKMKKSEQGDANAKAEGMQMLQYLTYFSVGWVFLGGFVLLVLKIVATVSLSAQASLTTVSVFTIGFSWFTVLWSPVTTAIKCFTGKSEWSMVKIMLEMDEMTD